MDVCVIPPFSPCPDCPRVEYEPIDPGRNGTESDRSPCSNIWNSIACSGVRQSPMVDHLL